METAAELLGYRFGKVELDLSRACLRVDGVDVGATPLPLKLLSLLCERDGALCTRDDIFAAVWPRQEVSDDALNKLISRVRELLGSAADCIVTVRKQGLRLDAPIERLVRLPNPVAEKAPSAPAPAAAPQSPPPALRRWLSALTLTLLGLAVYAWLYGKASTPPADNTALVFAGYALRAADLRASRGETLELVRAAEQALNRGDAGQARRLLQSAEQTEQNSAVLPALRAIEYGTDDAEPIASLLQRASSRLSARDSPYAHLLVSYALAREQSDEAQRAAVDALLTLRPLAWRIQLRRAHLDIQAGQSASALRHLRAIPLDQPPAQTLMFVLADRVSYGDVDAVETALAQGALANAPLQRDYVRTRMAWSARASDTGSRALVLADAAEAAAVFSVANQARELAAAYAYMSGDPHAEALLRRAAYALKEAGRAETAAPLLALAADVAQAQGRSDEARILLRQALSLSGPAVVRVELEISNARLGLLPRGSFLDTAGGTDDRFRRGEPALIAAWYAWMTGAKAQAVAALAEARAGGVQGSPHAESAAYLGLLLGEPAQDCWLDPPYPDVLRLASCRRLREAHTAP